MRRLLAGLALVAGGLMVNGVASATVYTYDFSSGGGGINGIVYDGNQQNLGGEAINNQRIGDVSQVLLFKVVLPANIAGATINSATLNLHGAQYNPAQNTGAINAVEIKPTSPDWGLGNGLWGNRYAAVDTGATKWMAQRNADASGTGWDGTTYNAGGDWASADVAAVTTQFGTLLDTQSLLGSTTSATWNVKVAVQDWAGGAANRGLALSFPTPAGTYPPLWVTDQNPVLTIDYTPVPEPASLSLLALGAMGLLRRRHA